jgi:hypothetical protein
MWAPSSLIATLVLAALLLGCSSHPEMTLVDPAKYTFHNCAQLERDMKQLREREQELRVLHNKAGREAPLIARAAYEPEYLHTIGNMRLIEAAARERECEPRGTPAIAAPAG